MAHLDLKPFTGPNAKGVLDKFALWLSDKSLVKQGENLERCVEKDLEHNLKPVLFLLELMKSPRPGYTVLRSAGPNAAKIYNSTGPAYLIPIRIWSGNPTVSTRKATVGEAIYITEQVDVGPGLDFVMIVP